MTKEKVSETVGMFATVGEMLTTVGKCPEQWGNVRDSGAIEFALRNVRLEIVIHKSA